MVGNSGLGNAINTLSGSGFANRGLVIRRAFERLSLAHITEGKTHDITVARRVQFAAGTIVVMDRAYVDFDWWERLSEGGVYFVTRLKKDIQYDVLEECPAPQQSDIRRDQIIQLRSSLKRSYAMKLRVVTMWNEEKQEELQFLTNHLKFGVTTIARIHKERWQIEICNRRLHCCGSLQHVSTLRGSRSRTELQRQCQLAQRHP